MNKAKKLYEDWKQSKNVKYIKEADSILEQATKNSSYLKKFVEYLGEDGKRIHKYFLESNSSDPMSKRRFASFLLEDNGSVVNGISLSHMPVEDRSKSIVSQIEAGTISGLPAEILRAIVGGNLSLAAQLTAQSWGKLSIADRNLIMQLAQVHGNYNADGVNPKDSGHTQFYEIEVKSDIDDDQKIEKKSDLPKKDFLKQAFPFTDIENMKI